MTGSPNDTLGIELEGSFSAPAAGGAASVPDAPITIPVQPDLTTAEVTSADESGAAATFFPTPGSPFIQSPGAPLPFLFAWVNEDETEFNESMLRVDEEILDIDLKHEEGQIPTLSITIKNPRIGLLNPSRKQWAWLAYQPPVLDPYFNGTYAEPGDFSHIPNGYGSSGATNNSPGSNVGTPEYVSAGYVQQGYQVYDGATVAVTPTPPTRPNTGTSPLESPTALGPPPYTNGNTVVPIFFGVLVGIPNDLMGEKITLKFLARSPNYIQWKQSCAETLKVPGNYDPVFLTEKERDDPDKVLEGWSSLYHVDRCTLAVTASDVLVGEDGTVTFTESPATALYSSVNVKIGKAPLTNVQVQAQVHWTQRTLGYVTGPEMNLSTYCGETITWPEPGKSLGGGWTVETSFLLDNYLVALTPTYSLSGSTQFYGDLVDYDCAVVSIDVSQSGPAFTGPSKAVGTTVYEQIGVCDPYSDPPTNIPAKLKTVSAAVAMSAFNGTWTLEYRAKREFTETLFVDVTANTQSVLTSPLVEQDTELIKGMNGEVGQPVLIYEAWTDYEHSFVAEGQLIYPNDATTPGGLSYQVAISSGTTGTIEPAFSDVPGVITQDNEVQWASLGETPQSKIQQMTFATNYNVGTILMYAEQVFDPNQGTLVPTLNTAYYLVVAPCETTSIYTEITYTPPVDQSGHIPQERNVLVEQFYPVEGSMVQLPLSASFLGIPVGGTAENVTARCYFPTDRGAESIQYAINRARAKIRMRARAVEVSWDCPIEMVLGMSCRMNATLYEPRLPGGVATGKVTTYGMSAKNGQIRGHVTIGCSVGLNAYGSPLPDISYTPAVFEPFDDGLAFPLGYLPCDGGIYTSTLAEQEAALNVALQEEVIILAATQVLNPVPQTQTGSGGSTTTVTGTTPGMAWKAAAPGIKLSELMQGSTISWAIEIDPVVNGPFLGAYTINVTPLELPQGINLAADSTE